MDSSTTIATLSTSKPSTIASRRPLLQSQKSFSVLSINTSATHKDLLRRNSSATTFRQKRLQMPTNVPLLPLSTHDSNGNATSMSPEELSSKIADSFQQFSSMLSQLSSSNNNNNNNNNNSNNNKTPINVSAHTDLKTPVTPPLSVHPTANTTPTVERQQTQHNVITSSLSPLSPPSPPPHLNKGNNNKTTVITEDNLISSSVTNNNALIQNQQHWKEIRSKAVVVQGVPSSNNHLASNLPQVKHINNFTTESESDEEEEKEKDYFSYNAFSITNPSFATTNKILKRGTRLRRRLICKWLTRAALYGDLDTMQQMLNTLDDININCTDDKKTGVTSLMYASYFGHTECLRLLLKQSSIQINQQDKKGWTALIWAINGHQKEIVEILLKSGAERSLETIYGRTVFDYSTVDSVKEILGNPPTESSSSKLEKQSSGSHEADKKQVNDKHRISNNSSSISSEVECYAVDGYNHFLNNHNSGAGSSTNSSVFDRKRKSIYSLTTSTTTTAALSPPDFSQLIIKANVSPPCLQEDQNKVTAISMEENQEELKRWETSIKSSNTFSWNQCLPDQMFVFNQDDMHTILDQALNVTDIKSLMNKNELDNDIWQPANIIFLSARFVHYCLSRELLGSLLSIVAAKLSRVIKASSRDTLSLVYWIANMCQLLSYFKKDPGLSVSTLEAQQVLSELISEAYSHFITESQKKFDKILEPCIMDFESIHELEQVDFVDDWQRFFFRRSSSSNHCRKSIETDKRLSIDSTSTASMNMTSISGNKTTASSPSSSSTSSPENVTKLLSEIQYTLQAYHVPPTIVIQAVAQFFHYLSCELFNRVLMYKRYLCRSKALQIRRNLSTMEEWVRVNELPVALINSFEPLVQLLQLLQCLSQMNDIILFTSTVQTFDKLNPLQVKRCVQNYRYEMSEPKLPEEVKKLASQMVLNHQHQRMMTAATNSSNNDSKRNSSSSIISKRISMDNTGIGSSSSRGIGEGGRPASISSLNCLLTTTANKKRLSLEELLSINNSLQQLDNTNEEEELEEKRNSKYLLPFSIPITTALLQGWTEEKHNKKIMLIEQQSTSNNGDNYSNALYQEIKLRKQEQQCLLDKIYPSISEEWLYNLDKRLHVR